MKPYFTGFLVDGKDFQFLDWCDLSSSRSKEISGKTPKNLVIISLYPFLLFSESYPFGLCRSRGRAHSLISVHNFQGGIHDQKETHSLLFPDRSSFNYFVRLWSGRRFFRLFLLWSLRAPPHCSTLNETARQLKASYRNFNIQDITSAACYVLLWRVIPGFPLKNQIGFYPRRPPPAHNGSVSCWWSLAGWFSITVPARECGLLSVLPPAGRAGPAGVA